MAKPYRYFTSFAFLDETIRANYNMISNIMILSIQGKDLGSDEVENFIGSFEGKWSSIEEATLALREIGIQMDDFAPKPSEPNFLDRTIGIMTKM